MPVTRPMPTVVALRLHARISPVLRLQAQGLG
nr:MAG TPA: hypothetical protein [Caudoviricetes sp.]